MVSATPNINNLYAEKTSLQQSFKNFLLRSFPNNDNE